MIHKLHGFIAQMFSVNFPELTRVPKISDSDGLKSKWESMMFRMARPMNKRS